MIEIIDDSDGGRDGGSGSGDADCGRGDEDDEDDEDNGVDKDDEEDEEEDEGVEKSLPASSLEKASLPIAGADTVTRVHCAPFLLCVSPFHMLGAAKGE